MSVIFGTKAETLERLEAAVTHAHVLPQERVTWRAWTSDRGQSTACLDQRKWLNDALIVRSSATGEDSADQSLAGRFLSVRDLTGRMQVEDAISRVFASYGAPSAEDHVFIQPCLNDVSMSGVAFSRDPSSGAPYIIINYSLSGDTSAVTGGAAQDLQTFYFWKEGGTLPDGVLGKVIHLLRELEQLLNTDAIDVEFALSARFGLCLLQVRPLRIAHGPIDAERHKVLLTQVARRIEAGSRPHPYLHGRRGIFGVMPDWNPAEIIGTRPRPLALSLYRSLITDQIWAYQRNNYGYKNLRSFPLLVSFHGLPYVDVRVSFNSFIPADIGPELADRLADYYLDRLRDAPALHDKVEFEIVFSCYTLDLPDRLAALKEQGFSGGDIATLSESLRGLTNRIIHSDRGLWRADLKRIDELDTRRRLVLGGEMDHVSRIYWLIEDCKRWGTLPFAGLARAGFVAMQMLRSMVAMGVIDNAQHGAFLGTLDTVTSQMMRDLKSLNRTLFLEKYGHLRPGTYDILSPRYDEAPDRYLGAAIEPAKTEEKIDEFRLTLPQMRSLSTLLEQHGLEMEVVGLFDFIKSAVQGREHAKFLFTRSLSDVLSLLTDLGRQHGLSADDLSYADISVIEDLYASARDPGAVLRQSIAAGRESYQETRQITLPPLITGAADAWSFHMPPSEPNYVTQSVAEGPARTCAGPADTLKGAIIFIPNADPGFDWIFSKGIAGLVTAYGGVNSHMAIRAGECGLPAVIGAGETLFNVWQKAKRLRIDCANRRVEVLQ